MNVPFLPWTCSSKTPSRFPLALVSGLLLCVVPTAARGQSVVFAGAPTVLTFSGFSGAGGVAVDSTGNVFVTDVENNRVLELPWTGTDFGPQTTLPTKGLVDPYGIAVDKSGDLFISQSGDINYNSSTLAVELPKTATGFAPQVTVFDGGENFSTYTLAADQFGHLFIGETDPTSAVQEISRDGVDFTSPQALPTVGLGETNGLAVDSAGDVFIADFSNDRVVELPRTGILGYGTQTILYVGGEAHVKSVAVDSNENLFISDELGIVIELPHTATGFGPPLTLPYFSESNPGGSLVADSLGDLFAGNGAGAIELQMASVNFGSANICAAGATHPQPCSQTQTLYYRVNADVTLGTPKVLTSGTPDLDFRLAKTSTCTGTDEAGSFCKVHVTFTPLQPGVRQGSVEIVDGSGTVLATTPIYGTSVAIGDTPQTIDFTPISTQTAGTEIPLAATASSGLPVTFTSSTQKICTVTGSTAILFLSGECELEAHQAGNAEYYPASLHQSFYVRHVSQSIYFPSIPPQVAGTEFIVQATASSGMTVTFASTTPEVCKLTGNFYLGVTATLLAEGTCNIHALQSGDNYYAAVTSVHQSFHVSHAHQIITFDSIPHHHVGAMVKLDATATSGLPVTLTSLTPTVCTISGRFASMIATGSCSIEAIQPGDAAYYPTGPLTRSFAVE